MEKELFWENKISALAEQVLSIYKQRIKKAIVGEKDLPKYPDFFEDESVVNELGLIKVRIPVRQECCLEEAYYSTKSDFFIVKNEIYDRDEYLIRLLEDEGGFYYYPVKKMQKKE